ncbi:hypothetical protein [Rhizobacter sp. Root404]|jgi:hypothetical protein|uniref:hypothetical protein n=1 Tax=Rhizobacter sp. Root404 TaxID=1736528 RepID=UPI0006FB051D|nr:hypothetical protein [Rhizobacter sp. Root404]KQW38773.1 hypothetical protein ASC76_12420 [Rhizobacter sp. Root404]
MNKFQMLWAPGLASALLVLGCANEGHIARAGASSAALLPASPCPGSDDQVELNQIMVPAPPASASVRVAPGKARVDWQKGGVRWKIAGNQYLFTDDGITFKSAVPYPPGPASSGVSADRSNYWWCFNQSTQGSTWSYTIRFYDKNVTPRKVWSCDPIIVNFDSLVATPRVPETVECR